MVTDKIFRERIVHNKKMRLYKVSIYMAKCLYAKMSICQNGKSGRWCIVYESIMSIFKPLRYKLVYKYQDSLWKRLIQIQ